MRWAVAVARTVIWVIIVILGILTVGNFMGCSSGPPLRGDGYSSAFERDCRQAGGVLYKGSMLKYRCVDPASIRLP